MVLAMASLLSRILSIFSIFGPAAKSAVTDAVKGELQRRDTVTEAGWSVEPTGPQSPAPSAERAARPAAIDDHHHSYPGRRPRLALGRWIAVGSGLGRASVYDVGALGLPDFAYSPRSRWRARPR